MEISTILNVHSNIDLIRDTCESILTYATKNILLVVDGSSKLTDDELESLGVSYVRGFRHGVSKSPYRNMAFGLKLLSENWPNSDWYCYTEYDTLFTSSRFKSNLKMADERNVWMLGNCGRVDEVKMPLIESLIGEKFRSVYYMLGCCQFMSKHFISKLNEINFFDRFLNLTNDFSLGYFPSYNGYDISEHMYPTLCRHFGGNVGVFATWDEEGEWHGSYEYFPMRWKPELDIEKDDFPMATIMHPLKKMSCPIRELHRNRRRHECVSVEVNSNGV